MDSIEQPSYKQKGRDWAETVDDAELCGKGREQSPIDLTLEQIEVSDKMEINGYGYVDFTATK